MKAAQFLKALFETDPNSSAYWNLTYDELHFDFGAKLWWDPFTWLWAMENPYEPDSERWRLWIEARALLDDLHTQYLAARKQGKPAAPRKKARAAKPDPLREQK